MNGNVQVVTITKTQGTKLRGESITICIVDLKLNW